MARNEPMNKIFENHMCEIWKGRLNGRPLILLWVVTDRVWNCLASELEMHRIIKGMRMSSSSSVNVLYEKETTSDDVAKMLGKK